MAVILEVKTKLSCDTWRTILWGQETGQWLPVLPSNVNGMELSAPELCDALLLRYARSPPGTYHHTVMAACRSSAFAMHLSAKQEAVLSSHITMRFKMN
jgi:hypothetical protein